MHLQPQGALPWHRLVFETNITLAAAPAFRPRGTVLEVTREGRPWLTVQGWRAVTVDGGPTYRPRMHKLALRGLEAPEQALSFDWRLDCRAGEPKVVASLDDDPHERYAVLSDESSPLRLRTSVRVETDAPPRHPELMLVCLSYFWNHFEIERRQS